jgi:hypothetical protein
MTYCCAMLKYDVFLLHTFRNKIMQLEIFEPALCCSSGVCGPEPDRALIELQNSIQILGKAGIIVNRYAINQVPLAFTGNPVVKQFIISNGPGQLPLTLLDGKIVKTEAYPTIEDLSVLIPEIRSIKPADSIPGIFS